MYKGKTLGGIDYKHLVILIFVIFFSLTQAFDDITAQEGDKGISKIVLEIALCLDEPATTLAFTITNNSDKDFTTTPIRTNYNRIVIVTSDGKERESFSWKDGIAPVIIKPSEKKTWKANITQSWLIAELFTW